MPPNTNFYDRLGISSEANDEEVKAAFRKAAQRLHPDVNVEPGATELFLDIKEAYEVLSNPNTRADYDGKVSREKIPPPPVRINTYYSRSALSWLNEPQLHYVVLEMEILADLIEEDDEETPPTNVVLVLDNSTSMTGPRLDVLKASAIEIINQLRPQDVLAIVAFNDRAEVILPAASHANNPKSEGRVRALHTRGGTEIFQGLSAGFKEAKRNLSPYYINHIILLTDGRTYGDEKECLNLAEQAAELGLGISCLGVGSNWNDAFLDLIATKTGGSSLYIRRPSDIRKLLKQKFDGLGQVYVEGVKLELDIGPEIDLQYAFRLQPEASAFPTDSSTFMLGNIPRGARQSLLLEFRLSPIAPNIQQVLLAEGYLSFSIPKQAETTYRIPIDLIRPARAKQDHKPPPPIIVEAMSRLTLYRMQEQAKTELEAGNYEEATVRLQNIATQLFSQGESALAKTILSETKHIQARRQFSTNGDKAIKYGTRSLLLPDGQREA